MALSDVSKLAFFFRSLVVFNSKDQAKYVDVKRAPKSKKFGSTRFRNYFIKGQMAFPFHESSTQPVNEEMSLPTIVAKALDLSGMIKYEDDDKVARTGIKYLARSRFKGIEINGQSTSLEESLSLASRIKWRKSRHWKPIYVKNPANLESRLGEARNQISLWISRGELPYEFESGVEGIAGSFFEKFGRIVYSINGNMGFGEGVRRFIDETKAKISIRRKERIEKMRTCRGGSERVIDPLSGNLERAIYGVGDFSMMDQGELEILKIVAPYIAQEVKRIRESYGCNVKEIREGLINWDDKELLIKNARRAFIKQSRRGNVLSEEELSEGAKMIVRVANNRIAQVVSIKRILSNFVYLSPIIQADSEDYIKIGLERMNELLDYQNRPYKKEGTFLSKFLEYRLNRKQFYSVVNDWLSMQNISPIKWGELQFDPRYSKTN